MPHDPLLDVLREAAAAIRSTLAGLEDWGLAGTRPGQHLSDLAADAAAADVLERAGLGVLSEESGLHGAERPVVVIVDPVDGSTNAALGIPWYAASLCAVDRAGPRAALVVNLASGVTFEAVRGGGSRCDGERAAPSSCTELRDAVVAVSGWPAHHLGWGQFRALGAAALDLCSVAGGVLDAYVDCGVDAHGVWDYAAALLVCEEAGAPIVDLHGRDLISLDPHARRTPVAAGTRALLDELVGARLDAAEKMG